MNGEASAVLAIAPADFLIGKIDFTARPDRDTAWIIICVGVGVDGDARWRVAGAALGIERYRIVSV